MATDLALLEGATPPPAALARTYASRSYDDPWRAVVDYHRVIDAARADETLGSTALARRFDLPRSRVRAWLEGSKPAPVAAIETADARGWFVDDFSLPATEGTALATFVMWAVVGGSISHEYRPQFVLRASDREHSQTRLEDAAAFLGIDLVEVERLEGRSNEFVPREDAAVFGRLLAAAGAPVGPVSEASLALPWWIANGPRNVKRAAAVTYAGERLSPAGLSGVLQHRWPAAPTTFLQTVGALLVDVFGGSYTVENDHLRLDIEATRSARRVLAEYTRWP